MVIQPETYPGYGYQVQQTYTTVNDDYYSPNNRYSHYNPNKGPTPQTTTHLMPNNGYTHNPDDSNKYQTDHYSHGSKGKLSSFNSISDAFNPSGGQFHHGTPNGGYGTHDGSHASHQGSYGCHDATKHQTDHYSHGTNGKMSSFDNFSDAFKPSGAQFHQGTPNSGYGSHHGSHNPMLESARHQYGPLGNGGERYPTTDVYQSPGGMQYGCQKMMWELKCVED